MACIRIKIKQIQLRTTKNTPKNESQKSSLPIIRALSIPVGEHDVFQRVILSQFELSSERGLYV